MLFSAQGVIPLFVIALAIAPVGYFWGRRHAKREAVFRVRIRARIIEPCVIAALLVVGGNWLGAGLAWEGVVSGVRSLGIAGLLVVITVGPYLSGAWLGHIVHRRQRMRQAAQNPAMILSVKGLEWIASALARDGELLLFLRDKREEGNDRSLVVRSIDEVVALLLEHESVGAHAELQARGGETLRIERA